MSVMAPVIGVRRCVRNVLWPEIGLLLWKVLLLRDIALLLWDVVLLLWNVVLLLWKVLLLWDVALLRDVVGNMRLVNRLVLVVRPVSRMRHSVEMRCRMRHGMQMIAMLNDIGVRGGVWNVVNVCIRMIVLRESCLRRNKSNRQSQQTQFCF